MATNKISIVQGKKKEFTLDIDKGDDPLDLTNATEIKVCFPGTTAPVELSLTGGDLSVTNAALGKVSGTISSAKSAELVVGEDQNGQVEVAISSGDPEGVILSEILTVLAAIC